MDWHWANCCLIYHQSAESRISINRLRWRLRSHVPTIHASTPMPSAAPTIIPVTTQSLVAFDVHRLIAPHATASTIMVITRLSLIPEGAS